MILPNMGDLPTPLVAAVFRKVGINTEAMGVADKETLRLEEA